MPIKPENKSRYPPNWKEITAAIRKRADDKCEFCGAENGAIGYRDTEGKFYGSEVIINLMEDKGYDIFFHELSNVADAERFTPIKIVLTVAHMDHIPENCEASNLKALCQKCHNNYDKDHRKKTRRETKYKAQTKLFV